MAPDAAGARAGRMSFRYLSDIFLRKRVSGQFHERGDDRMVEVLSDLEADELLRIQVIEALRRVVRS
jgi:hypothetical protein